MTKDRKFVKFCFDVLTGDARGVLEDLTGAQRHQAAMHLYKHGTKDHPYRDRVLDLMKRLDFNVHAKAIKDWRPPKDRPDIAALRRWREETLGKDLARQIETADLEYDPYGDTED